KEGLAARLISGWTVSGIMSWESGAPFSILSSRGTLLRSFRSSQNTAVSILNKDELDDLLRFRMTPSGPFIAAASSIGSAGGAVSPDGAAPFTGQVFFNPAPGDIGALQRRWFSGPWSFNIDAALLKKISVGEGKTIELRGEALNVLNHPTWSVGDQDVNSTNF